MYAIMYIEVVMMTNTTITNFRKKIFAYVDQAIRFGDVVNVATKNGNAVLISEDEYMGMLETSRLAAIPGMVDSIKRAAAEPIEEGAVYVPGEDW